MKDNFVNIYANCPSSRISKYLAYYFYESYTTKVGYLWNKNKPNIIYEDFKYFLKLKFLIISFEIVVVYNNSFSVRSYPGSGSYLGTSLSLIINSIGGNLRNSSSYY